MINVALTYDDGPGPATPALLDVLREAGVRATFFVVGRNIEEASWCGGDTARARALVIRAIREGHVVGNHGYRHLGPSDLEQLVDDLNANDRVLSALRRSAQMGDSPEILFRLPYGIQNSASAPDPRLAILSSCGRPHVGWTADFQDWTCRADAGPRLVRQVIEHLDTCEASGADAVLDLHDGGIGNAWGYERHATVAATRLLLDGAGARRWRFVTIPQLRALHTARGVAGDGRG